MIINREEFTYLSGKGPIEQVGVCWTFKCDNPQCGKVFNRRDSRRRVERPHHYCCHPCSTQHVFGVCSLEDCNEAIKTQRHRKAKYSDLCSKHNGGSIKLRQYIQEPARYQLLCANCNYAKRMNDGEIYQPEKFTDRRSSRGG